MSQTSPQDQARAQQDEVEETKELALAQSALPQATEVTTSPKRSKHDPPSISVHEDTSTSETAEKLEDPPASPVATATPRVINSLRRDTPGKRSTSNKENVQPFEASSTPSTMRIEQLPATPSYDELEAAVVHAATPPTAARTESTIRAEQTDAVSEARVSEQAAAPTQSSRRESSARAGDAIEALDELDDAVESVKQAIPQVVSVSESRRASRIAQDNDKPAKTKSAPVVKMTKAAQARLSMAQSAKSDAGASARPRPSTTVGRPGSIRQSTALAGGLGRSSSVRQSTVPAAGKRVTSASSNKAGKDVTHEPREKKEAVIPHSKQRPISMSFPTPPPPSKSTKAPTRSSFQLPGEAVAAKLKAAREARAVAELSKAEEEKKPAFKARPAPSMLKKTPSVRQTAASRARDSTVNGNAAPKPTTSTRSTSPKRSNTVATSKPRPSTLSASTSIASARTNALAVPRSRPSTSGPCATSAPKPTSAAERIGRSVSAGTTKGKEVFNRAAAAKAAAEQEKKDKEEAAKKARAAAAERSRQISREWAEKQKAKKMGAATKAKDEGAEAVAA